MRQNKHNNNKNVEFNNKFPKLMPTTTHAQVQNASQKTHKKKKVLKFVQQLCWPTSIKAVAKICIKIYSVVLFKQLFSAQDAKQIQIQIQSTPEKCLFTLNVRVYYSLHKFKQRNMQYLCHIHIEEYDNPCRYYSQCCCCCCWSPPLASCTGDTALFWQLL